MKEEGTAMQNISVEELSRKLEGQRQIIIQEMMAQKPRQWVFEGERLKGVKEKSLQPEDLDQTDEVILVCDELKRCEELARSIDRDVQVSFLGGGYLAWGQFYHPVLVGLDEQIKVWQIHRLAKGCLSYLIVSGEQAAVIDPCYHMDYYLGLAHNQQTDIRCVIDTQVHTDHVSGGPRLAAKTNSPYYLPSHEGLKSDSLPLEKESILEVNKAKLQVFPLSPSTQNGQGVFLLLNDQYLFVGDAPIEKVKASLSGQAWSKDLDQNVLILPAHLKTWGRINAHGIVASTLEQLDNMKTETAREGTVVLTQPPAKEEEILKINLAQQKINLDQANQLDLGLERTP